LKENDMGSGLSDLQRELLRLAATAPAMQPFLNLARVDAGFAFDIEALVTYYGAWTDVEASRFDVNHPKPEMHANAEERRKSVRQNTRLGLPAVRGAEAQLRGTERTAISRAISALERHGLIERHIVPGLNAQELNGFRLTQAGRRTFSPSISSNT
jgi:hypothetical protein